MRMRRLLLLSVLAGVFLSFWGRLAYADGIDTAWVHWYDGPAAMNDNAWDVDTDDADTVFVTGSAQAPVGMFSPIHVLTMKFTPEGDTAWVRLLLTAGESNNQGKLVRADDNGNVIVAAINQALELWLIKYDADGDTLWTRPYQYLLNPIGMELNAAGDIWVIGVSGTNDWRTVHYLADGTFQWVATFADIGGGSDVSSDIAIDGSDNAYVTGYGTYVFGNVDVITVKYSSTGSELWRRRYDGFASGADQGVRVKLAGDDTVYVAGVSEAGPGDNDFLLIRYQPDGDTVWTRRFDAPGTGADVLYDADVDGDGNMYLSGTIYTSGSSSHDGTVKFNSAGDTLWARYWGPSLRVRAVAAAANGDLFLTGEGQPPGSLIYYDWGVLKYTPTGDSAGFRWLYNGVTPVGFQVPHALALSPDGGLLACGLTSSGAGGSNDVTVAKFISGCQDWYLDSDSDGYGDPANSVFNCGPPPGYVADNTDCNDTDGGIHPGAQEVCDGKDNDCDGNIDNDAIDAPTWYEDADGDNFGNTSVTLVQCTQPSGYVADNTDCNDTDSDIYPGAPEVCDGKDNDCDGNVDNNAIDAPTWYADADGDNFGDPLGTIVQCTAPPGFVADNTDCNDADASVHPGAPEVCDGKDNDCDGNIDNNAIDAPTWYADADSDNFGDAATTLVQCTQPSGYVADNTDCNDLNAAINPSATEICDGVDNDCDGMIDGLCPYQSDFDANGVLDALDFNALIDALFFGGADPQDPGCPTTRGDFNNDGVIDALDLNDLITHLFFGGPPPVNPC